MSCCAPAGIYNITAKQGSTFSRTITWTDSAKAPIAIGGWTARMHVRPDVTSSTVTISLTTENGRITLGADNSADTKGQITLLIDANTMANVTAGQYVYDLELVATGGTEVHSIIEGNFVVKAEVTR